VWKAFVKPKKSANIWWWSAKDSEIDSWRKVACCIVERWSKKPAWFGDNNLLAERNHWIRKFIIFSRTFPKTDVRDIGQKLSDKCGGLLCSSTETIVARRHEDGKEPDDKMWLRVKSRIFFWRITSMLRGIVNIRKIAQPWQCCRKASCCDYSAFNY